ncbi:MAG: DUF6356 family protein [Burkholderiaceae bacterium]|nr:DUF6356 family protein [Burkholderiaceae bacterium]MCD8538021.1 DUF6356 family protein [Burkholderiaceae bacterium]MCD8564189.1 DUF6356 family protein [Burkholderiaceae bacterium]
MKAYSPLRIINDSKQHLQASRVSYFPHLFSGVWLGFKIMYLGLTSIFHAFVPAWFEGDAPLGVANLFYRKVYNHPNPAFQQHIKAEREAAEAAAQGRTPA